ncbi:MAG: hypothetical protein EOO01_06580 [Chitinophagaceae bacterium]|nr:MAG: hypothetical protein EOO01_06580 [Chitinophagaceae bacterium]
MFYPLVIVEALNELETELKQTGSQVHIGELPSAYINPKQLRQLFVNLLSNSIKFSRKGIPLKISVTASRLSNAEKTKRGLPGDVHFLDLKYSDNGIGFEQEYAEKIFQMFQRLHGKE